MTSDVEVVGCLRVRHQAERSLLLLIFFSLEAQPPWFMLWLIESLAHRAPENANA